MMTNEQFRAARITLGLTPKQLGKLLEIDANDICRIEGPTTNIKAKAPPRRSVALLQAYLSGYRPSDWPEGVE